MGNHKYLTLLVTVFFPCPNRLTAPVAVASFKANGLSVAAKGVSKAASAAPGTNGLALPSTMDQLGNSEIMIRDNVGNKFQYSYHDDAQTKLPFNQSLAPRLEAACLSWCGLC